MIGLGSAGAFEAALAELPPPDPAARAAIFAANHDVVARA